MKSGDNDGPREKVYYLGRPLTLPKTLARMMNKTFFVRLVAALLILLFLLAVLAPLGGCQQGGPTSSGGGGAKQLSLAVNSGVEGDALKAAARDYEAQTGVRVQIAEFPYANLFEKELVDLQARDGRIRPHHARRPVVPALRHAELLTDLTPLYEKSSCAAPDEDFVSTSLALCREPYETGDALRAPLRRQLAALLLPQRPLREALPDGRPRRWDDVLAAARTIHEREATGAPGGGRVHGYVMRAAQGNAVGRRLHAHLLGLRRGDVRRRRAGPRSTAPKASRRSSSCSSSASTRRPATPASTPTRSRRTCCKERPRCPSTGPRGSAPSPTRRRLESRGQMEFAVDARREESRPRRDRQLAHRHPARLAQRGSRLRLPALGDERRSR